MPCDSSSGALPGRLLSEHVEQTAWHPSAYDPPGDNTRCFGTRVMTLSYTTFCDTGHSTQATWATFDLPRLLAQSRWYLLLSELHCMV
ncbi:uncharacterized protein YALI1_F14090g [Yarrowia lipolytica]|uniref:Uncharacterized protein n=1 Tax=Yarrowia lipolytica TaxID=4952 RepID=A0A1D8NMU2_YARLL|nr:hypothetical protein YALI1_F14090g [Yarrowia lipolytica]